MAGVVVAVLSAFDRPAAALEWVSLEPWLVRHLGTGAYQLLGLAMFVTMAGILFRVARRPQT